ncbi:hypothetical protein [Pseudomonas oryzihabitans]|uniref:hypothetical protein n=1 Tax=Pseudomonas oryzihabitans TaxID=47885 RepID=UPI0019822DF6|nr:hypothetical protein [Pseudomonas psychrotolerans]
MQEENFYVLLGWNVILENLGSLIFGKSKAIFEHLLGRARRKYIRDDYVTNDWKKAWARAAGEDSQ